MTHRRTIPRRVLEGGGSDSVDSSPKRKVPRLFIYRMQQCLPSASATLTMVIAGSVNGWTTISLAYLISGTGGVPLTLTHDESSWMVSLTVLGSMIGSLVAGQLVGSSRRKNCLVLCNTMFTLGWFIIYAATSVPMLYLARGILGIGVGIARTVNPMYVAGVADINIRSALSYLNVVDVSIGILATCVLGLWLMYESLLQILAIISFISFLSNRYFTETPYFSVETGETKQACKSIAYYQSLINMHKRKMELYALRTQTTYELHPQSTSELNQPSTSKLHRTSTSEIHEASISQTHQSSSSKIHQPSTSQTHQSSSSEIHQPSTSQMHRSSSSEIHQPSTSQTHQSSSSEIHQPSTSQTYQSFSSEIHQPSTSQMHRSSSSEINPDPTSEIHQPSRSQIHQPSTSEIHEASISQTHQSSSSKIHQPSTSQTHQSSSSEIHQPSTSQMHRSSSSEIHQPSTSQMHRSSSSEIHQPSTSQTHQSSSSEIHQPSTSQTYQSFSSEIHQPSTSQMHRSSSSEIHQPSTSQTHRSSSSEIHQPSTSEIHEASTRQTHQSSSREIHQPSTSQMHRSSSSEIHSGHLCEILSDPTCEILSRSRSDLCTQSNEDLRQWADIDETHIDLTKYNWSTKLQAILQRSNRKALFIMLGLIMAQHLSGNYITMQYLLVLFGKTTISSTASAVTISVLTVGLLSGTLSTLTVKSLGRRTLLILSTLGSCFTLIILATYLLLVQYKSDVSILSPLPVIDLIIYQVTFHIGLGTLPNVLQCELFPTELEGFVGAIIVIFDGIIGFTVPKLYQMITDNIGSYAIYYIFATSCWVAFVMVFIWVPETKGKTYHEVEALLVGKNLNSSNEEGRTDEMDIRRI